MATVKRDPKGKFAKKHTSKRKERRSYVITEHNYSTNDVVLPQDHLKSQLPAMVKRNGWKHGRRIVDFDVLLSGLKSCEKCNLGPVPLTYFNILGELKKGLGGYLYVQCERSDCRHINRVAYGRTYRKKKKGMPRFSVNTKLGTGL